MFQIKLANINSNLFCREILCYDLENNSWFQPEIDEPKPQGRYGQTQIVLNEHNLLIIGKTKTVSICGLVFILTLLIVKKRWLWGTEQRV